MARCFGVAFAFGGKQETSRDDEISAKVAVFVRFTPLALARLPMHCHPERSAAEPRDPRIVIPSVSEESLKQGQKPPAIIIQKTFNF